MPYESFPPFAIIVGAITAMGGVHYAVQMLYEGKPKPVGQDNFDRLMKYRDERVRAEAKVRDDSLGSTERRRPPVAIPSRGRGRSDLGFLFVSARASDHLARSLSLSVVDASRHLDAHGADDARPLSLDSSEREAGVVMRGGAKKRGRSDGPSPERSRRRPRARREGSPAADPRAL